MILNRQEYLDKVLGCWMGKNIGGTLGAPMEWRRQINNVSFYTQKLGGEPLPNDDLDIQLLWLVALEEQGVQVDARILGEYWCLYVSPHWVEYGTAKINLRRGIAPPLSGTLHNDYKHSCGAFIRAEIWACIAPGSPRTAVRYAYEDGILDHGDGEGTYAEMFTAAMESAAFVEKDLYALIDIGLSYIPPDCAVAQAVRTAIECYKAGKAWREARDVVLEKHRGGTFLNWAHHTSEEDRRKGFDKGKLGFDVPSNMGMLIIGLLYGEGDFDKSLCTAVNCGEDTDCTGATVGSLFGIMHGYSSIPEKWITPIGRKIKTAFINVGDMQGLVPPDVDNLTQRIERLARQVLLRYRLKVEIDDRPTDLKGVSADSLKANGWQPGYGNWGGPVYRFDFFDVAVDYLGEPAIRDAQPKALRVRIINTYRIQASLNLRWYLPEGWRVSPGATGCLMSLQGLLAPPLSLDFTFTADRVAAHANRLVLELTSDGRPLTMLVPVLLLNGNLSPTEPK